MVEKRQKIHIRILFFLDILSIVSSYTLAWYFIIYSQGKNAGVLAPEIYFKALIFIVPIYLIIYGVFELYKPKRTSARVIELEKIVDSNLIGGLIFATVLFIGSTGIIKGYFVNFSRRFIALFIVLNTLLTIFLRNVLKLVIKEFRKKGVNLRHVLIVGYSNAAEKFISKIHENPGWGYKIFGILDDKKALGENFDGIKIIGSIADLADILAANTLDEIAITLSLGEYSKLSKVVSCCEKSGVHTKFVPDYGMLIPTNPIPEDMDGLSVINIRAIPLASLSSRFIKRTIDIIGSIFGIIIFSPFMLIIAIMVKLSGPGKVLFIQERIGRHNKPFNMYKFRSMVEQKPEDEEQAWTTKGDMRVTKVGKIIRSTSLDEIPQFFNVLKGDMSLVGPRPERTKFVEMFSESIPRYNVKHQVRPGITGWAQVNGFRGDTSISERIEYDIWYIENWTLGLDIKILFLTIFKGFINRNAY